MKKWILLIGLLTYSSVGWSKTLIMECRNLGNLGEWVILKLDTDQSNNSDQLFTYRSDGVWLDMGCSEEKRTTGDESVVMTWTNYDNRKVKSVWDFRFLKGTSTSYKQDGVIYHKTLYHCRPR